MTCIGCGGTRFTDTFQEETDTFEGYRFMAMLPGRRCASCAWVYLDPAALAEYEVLIANRLGALGLRGGRALKFMRRVARVPIAELAARVGVYADAVRAWEDDQRPAPDAAFGELWSVVRERLESARRAVDSCRPPICDNFVTAALRD